MLAKRVGKAIGRQRQQAGLTQESGASGRAPEDRHGSRLPDGSRSRGADRSAARLAP